MAIKRKSTVVRTPTSAIRKPSRDLEQFELPVRVTIVRPPAGVKFCMQGRDREELVGQAISTGKDLSFDFSVRVALGGNGPPNFRGPSAHGTPDDRFVYVCSGTLAGQADSCWTRRAKVPLSLITRKLIEQARGKPSSRMEHAFQGQLRMADPCAPV